VLRFSTCNRALESENQGAPTDTVGTADMLDAGSRTPSTTCTKEVQTLIVLRMLTGVVFARAATVTCSA